MRANTAKLNMAIGFSGCILLLAVASSVDADQRASRRDGRRASLPDAHSRLPSYDDVRDRIEQAIPGILRAHGDGAIRNAYQAFNRRPIHANRKVQSTPAGQGAVPSCWVEDALGNPVFTVPASVQQVEPSHWLRYFDAGLGSGEVSFFVVPLFGGSPMTIITHAFSASSPGGALPDEVVTPFGVPSWDGNLTTGGWALVVFSNQGGVCVYFFFVVDPCEANGSYTNGVCNPECPACDPECECCADADCDDGIDCTVDTCNEAAGGTCDHTPDDTLCDDGVACTDDLCSESTGCDNVPNCDDDLFCNGVETCDLIGGECILGEDPCLANEVCDETNDACFVPCEVEQLLADDGAAFDLFGSPHAVAISDDTLVIGAPRHDHCAPDAGAAYVYRFDGLSWVLEAELLASDCAAGEFFGNSTAIDGDTIVIGANADSIAGSAYIFGRDDNGTPQDPSDDFWAQKAKLLASDGTAGDHFSNSVAISGNSVVIGANRDNSDTGAAYMFEKPNGGWTDMTETAKLTACDATTDAFFGLWVSISGDTVVIGAPVDDNENGSNAGAAYVFEKGAGWGDGCGNQVAKLLASDGAAGDQFGSAVSISGGTIVVGAYVDDSAAGSAYIFEMGAGWNDGSPNQTAKLTASDRLSNDFFGHRASISGDIAIIGAFGDDSRTGAAYVFQKSVGGWADMTETVKLTASDGAANHEFGSVAISGDTAVAGAAAFDNQNGTNVGAAYVFSMSATDCP